MTTKLKFIHLLALIIVISAAGCASIKKDYPERRFYQFELNSPVRTDISADNTVVQVREFNISPGSRGTEFIYRIGDFQYKSDFYNQFFASPAPLITQASTRYLEQTGEFADVINLMDEATPDYSIEGNVNRLYGDFRSSAAPKAVLEMQLFLLDSNDDINPSIIFGGIYSKEIPISSQAPEDLMNGWNRALEDILNEFRSNARSEIDAYRRSHPVNQP